MTRIPELVVLDFAGTTMRDDGAVLAAYREALARHDIPFTEDDLTAGRGASKRAVFTDLAARAGHHAHPAGVADQALGTFEAALRRAYAEGPVTEIPGAGAAIVLLRQRGIAVALTSGFERSLVDLLLGRLGWETHFDTVITASDVPTGRPAPFLIYQAMMDLRVPNVALVAVVGDTPNDLQSAANARAGWMIGVLSGTHTLASLRQAPHTHLIASVAELPGLFGVAALVGPSTP